MKRAQAAVAVIAVALALSCVALIVEAGRRIYRSVGPSKAVAAADGALYVLSHGKLHIFGADGQRRTVIALDSLGLTRTPSDLAVHEDGRIVVADPDSATLHRCRLPAGPCDTIDLDLHRVNLQQLVPLNSIKVAIDESARRYYVSDNGGHQVVLADFDGHVLDRSKPGLLWFPNHLWMSGPAELSVVDTNHHRIATLAIAGDRFGPIVREMAAGANAVTRRGRKWPFDASKLPDGRLVVLIADDGMKDADAVLFGNASAQERIRLGEDSDPFDVEVWRDRIIVADATHYRLQAVGFDGALRDDFPPPGFAAELAHARELPAYWKSVRTAAQAGILIVPLRAILVLWKLGVPLAPAAPARWADGAARPAARTNERFSLAYSPQFAERQVKLAKWAGGGLSLVLLALAGLVTWMFRSVMLTGDALLRFGPQLVLIALAPVASVIGMRQARQRARDFRLESSPEGLRIVGSGRPMEHQTIPWPRVFWDGSRLLVGKTMLIARHPTAGEMFEREAFERAILSRIPAANLVSRQRLATQMLRAGGPGTIVAFGIVLALLMLYAAVKFRLL